MQPQPRRRLLAAAAVTCMTGLGMIPAPPSQASDEPGTEARRPNVLLVNLDDATEKMLDWQKPNGNWVMPKVQQFKNKTTVFERTYVDIPSCCPSRFSTFTGRYPHNTGGKLQDDGTELPVDETFVHQLQQAGYATAMAGKFLVPWPIGDAPPSYDRYSFAKGGYYNPVINRNGRVATIQGYSTTILANDLSGYLDEFEVSNDAQPWYAYWAPQAPHIVGGFKTLAVPENRYTDVDMGTCAQPIEADRSDKPPYVSYTPPDVSYNQQLCTSQLQSLITVDKQFDDLLEQLKAMGEYGNTMVILTSDNGYHWGEQGWFSKFYPYEASVGIPLHVKWPANINKPVGADNRLTSSLDVTATIHDVTGVEPATILDGNSLLSPGSRQDVFVEYFEDPANGPFSTWSLLRGDDYKYIETRHVNPSSRAVTLYKEYYDLTADPDEATNVLQDGIPGNDPSPSELNALADRLRLAKRCSGSTCP